MKQRYKQKPGEFRLIRAFTMDHNIERLRKHVARIKRTLRNDKFTQVMRLKSSRQRQALISNRVKP